MTKKSNQKFSGPDKRDALGLFEWLRKVNVSDLVSSEMHSRDFNGSRAEFIYMRVRLLAFLFALLSILWIPIDIFIVPNESLGAILSLRIVYSMSFVVLGIFTGNAQKLNSVKLRLIAFVLIPCVFYVCSRLVLDVDTDAQGALVGYSFLPYITVVLLLYFH